MLADTFNSIVLEISEKLNRRNNLKNNSKRFHIEIICCVVFGPSGEFSPLKTYKTHIVLG